MRLVASARRKAPAYRIRRSRTGSTRPSAGRACRSVRRRRQIIEVGDGIRLRPQADLPGIRERLVVRVDDLLVVPVHFEVIADRVDPKRMPGAARYRAVPAGKLTA